MYKTPRKTKVGWKSFYEGRRRIIDLEESEQAQLARRVRELESRLSSVPAEPCKASFMDNMAERLNSASPSVFMNRDPDITSGSTSTIIRPETEPNGTTDEVAVDVLATDMFNDAQNCQERDIGYFGEINV